MASRVRIDSTVTVKSETALASKDRLQEIWSQLTMADREVLLGHSREELSGSDRTVLVRVIKGLGEQRRSQ